MLSCRGKDFRVEIYRGIVNPLCPLRKGNDDLREIARDPAWDRQEMEITVLEMQGPRDLILCPEVASAHGLSGWQIQHAAVEPASEPTAAGCLVLVKMIGKAVAAGALDALAGEIAQTQEMVEC